MTRRVKERFAVVKDPSSPVRPRGRLDDVHAPRLRRRVERGEEGVPLSRATAASTAPTGASSRARRRVRSRERRSPSRAAASRSTRRRSTHEAAPRRSSSRARARRRSGARSRTSPCRPPGVALHARLGGALRAPRPGRHGSRARALLRADARPRVGEREGDPDEAPRGRARARPPPLGRVRDGRPRGAPPRADVPLRRVPQAARAELARGRRAPPRSSSRSASRATSSRGTRRPTGRRSSGRRCRAPCPSSGPRPRALMAGGAAVGAATLTRFYAVHVVLLPILALVLVAVHLLLLRKHGHAGPTHAPDPRQPFFPYQAARDAVVGLALVLAALRARRAALPRRSSASRTRRTRPTCRGRSGTSCRSSSS